MTKHLSILLISLLLFGCVNRKHATTVVLDFKGKPLVLKYSYQLKYGNIRWKISSELQGKVSLVLSSDCTSKIDLQCINESPTVDTFEDLTKEYEPLYSFWEEMRRGVCTQFLFVPEDGATGKITLRFLERNVLTKEDF